MFADLDKAHAQLLSPEYFTRHRRQWRAHRLGILRQHYGPLKAHALAWLADTKDLAHRSQHQPWDTLGGWLYSLLPVTAPVTLVGLLLVLTGCSSQPEPREALQVVMDEWEVPKVVQSDVVLYTIASCAAEIKGLDHDETVDYMVEHAPVLAIGEWVGDNHQAWGHLQVEAMDALCPEATS